MCGFAELFQGAGAVAGGIQSYQSGRVQDAQLRTQARYARLAATHQAARFAESADQEQGRRLAQLAGGGLALEGSLLDAVLAGAVANRAQQEQIRQQGVAEAAQLRGRAAFAAADTRAGLIRSGFGAATSLLAAAEAPRPQGRGPFLGLFT